MTVTADSPPETARRSATRWARALLPWALLAAVTGWAVFATVGWRSLEAREDTRVEVAVAASNFLTELTDWDASGGLEDTVQSLRSLGTGRFLTQVEDLFGGTIGEDLAAAQATSEGSIEDLFVQSVEDGTAEVFAVVRQTVTSNVTEGPVVTIQRTVLRLERVDGAWRIERVESIDDPLPTEPAG